MDIECLARLCAGSVKLGSVGGRSTGGDALRGVEIAGLLAGMLPHEISLALAKYAGDSDAERDIVKHVRGWAQGVASEEHWKIIDGRPSVLNMAELAVYDVVRPNRCEKCGGGGYVGVFRLCKACHGSGFLRLSGRSVAERIGVDECNYRRVWKSRFNRCVAYVQGIDSKVNFVFWNNSK